MCTTAASGWNLAKVAVFLAAFSKGQPFLEKTFLPRWGIKKA